MREVKVIGEVYQVHLDWNIRAFMRSGYIFEFEHGLYEEPRYLSLDLKKERRAGSVL